MSSNKDNSINSNDIAIMEEYELNDNKSDDSEYCNDHLNNKLSAIAKLSKNSFVLRSSDADLSIKDLAGEEIEKLINEDIDDNNLDIHSTDQNSDDDVSNNDSDDEHEDDEHEDDEHDNDENVDEDDDNDEEHVDEDDVSDDEHEDDVANDDSDDGHDNDVNNDDEHNFDNNETNDHDDNNIHDDNETNDYDDNNIHDDKTNDNNDSDNDILEETISSDTKRKRGIPKTILANQKKYLEVLEKQQKMMSVKKDKNKNQIKGKKNVKEESVKKISATIPEGTRRVIVAGKVKYIPIINTTKENSNINHQKSNSKITDDENIDIPIFKKSGIQAINKNIKPSSTASKSSNNTDKPSNTNKLSNIMNKPSNTNKLSNVNNKLSNNTNKPSNVNNKPSNVTNKPSNLTNKSLSVTNKSISQDKKNIAPSKILEIDNIEDMDFETLDEPMTETKKIPSSILKKMEIHKLAMAKQSNVPTRKTSTGKKIPSKYAKQIENDVKKQTVKNIKNFSDLRRIKAIQDISTDSNMDTNRASIIELRKLKVEQRKKDQNEMRKRSDANKRESAIQEILKNDKMSKFAKTVAIKNLSVNSRNRTRVLSQQAEL